MMMSHAAPRPSLSPLPRRRDDLRVEIAATGHVLHEEGGEEVHLLNETAYALWQLCDGGTTPEEMAAGVCELFGEPSTAVLEDVDRTLAELARRGLVAWAGGEGTA